MKSGVFRSGLGLVVLVLMTASLSFARLWGEHKSSDKSANITIASVMALSNGNVLKAGSYHLEVPEDSQAPEVSFYKDGKVVAKAPAKVVAENQKNPYSEVDSIKQGNKDVITEIRPGGWAEKLVFSETSGQTYRGGR